MIEIKTKKDLINLFFNSVNKIKAEYCVLRNYENLPNDSGNDIDILIEKSSLEKFHNFLEENQEILNYTLLVKKDNFETIVLEKKIDNKLIVLKLDLWTSLSWRGVLWADSSYILTTKLKIKNFYIPSPGAEAATLLLKELMGNGDIPKKYYNRIYEYTKKDRDVFIKTLDKTIGNESSNILELVLKKEFKKIDLKKSKLKKSMIKESFFGNNEKKNNEIFVPRINF